jgi:hypothetical protein
MIAITTRSSINVNPPRLGDLGNGPERKARIDTLPKNKKKIQNDRSTTHSINPEKEQQGASPSIHNQT